MLCGLIMAGGKGERFWPLSTEQKPKQFLNLLGEETMIQMTVNRLEKLMPLERIFIVTAKGYVGLIKEQLPELPERNIIIEPVGKNTAPCIALSAFTIDKYFKDSTLVVVPSDHLIRDENNFAEIIKAGNEFVEKHPESIVTLGIKPNRPETGYGYIKFKEIAEQIYSNEVYNVDCFVEKPNLENANKYLADGRYLWNSGMFVWKVDTIKTLTNLHMPQTYTAIGEIAASMDTDSFDEVLNDKYNSVQSISVDYGIMEKAQKLFVIPSDFGWDDIGSWTSIERYRSKDHFNNICVGDIEKLESKNNLVMGNGKKIALVGLDDVFVIDSDEILLIGKKEYLNDIKRIKKDLKA